jgi:hypothetical protein
MAVRLRYLPFTERLVKSFLGVEQPIARAATAAIAEAGDTVKGRVRADIAAAGFSRNWQNAFRAQQYPKGGKISMGPAVHFFHKIPYADVFESGATIRGKPKLWLPLPSVPRGNRGNKPLTPKQYVQRVGPLVGGKSKSGTPLLFGRASRRTVLRAGERSTRVRKGAFGKVFSENVPLYVGIDSVTIGKKFHIRSIVQSVGSRIGALYLKHFRQ